MIFLIIVLASAISGVIPLWIAGQAKASVGMGLIYAGLTTLMTYFGLPYLDYTLGGAVFAMTLAWTCVSVIVVRVTNGYYDFPKLSVIPSSVGIVIISVLLISGCGACNTGTYSALIGNIESNAKTLKHWTQQNQELSPSHIRMVPEEHAIAIAKTALNQDPDKNGDIVGSQFPLSEAYTTLQKVNGELYYVIPLDYRSWGVWKGTNGVPGFVMVNAEDQHAKPVYVDGFKMKFTPGACFGENLERYLYNNGYADKVLTDYSFEVDDNRKPYWVVSVGHHTIGVFSGLVIDGVVIVDPETGVTNYYDKSKTPVWVDRVIPADVVNDNLNYWGQYLNGWWNNTSFGSSTNVRKPETTVLNYGADGTCWYVTPMTSNSQKDNSMTDLVYTNSRTGESRRYSVSGATEEKILATVNATVKYQNLSGAAVVYENVSDRLTALVPIIAEDNSIRGLALVDVTTKSVVWDPEPMNALMKYQNSLSALGSGLGTDIASNEVSYEDVVTRINQANTSSGSVYYLYFKSKRHLYMVPQTFHKVLITQPGDSVVLKYLDGESDLVSVISFDNLNVNIEMSKNQKDSFRRTEQRRSNERTNDRRNSAVGTINNGDIKPEVLDSIAKKLGNKKEN